jgi:hypothetical protein
MLLAHEPLHVFSMSHPACCDCAEITLDTAAGVDALLAMAACDHLQSKEDVSKPPHRMRTRQRP